MTGLSRRVGTVIGGLVVGSVVALGLAEGAVRVLDPAPRAQVVRLDHPSLVFDLSGEVPLWSPVGLPPFRELGCEGAEDATVLVAGDSVFFSTVGSWEGEATTEHRFAGKLRDALEDHDIDICVVDASTSGFRPDQVLETVRRAHGRYDLDAVVFLVWKPHRPFIRIGGSLYDPVRPLDALGTPRSLVPMPVAWHRTLFERSRLWELVTLAGPEAEDADSGEAYFDAVAWATATKMPMLMVEAVPLHQPFAASVVARADDPMPWRRELERAAVDAGIAYAFLGDVLIDEDVEALRHDTCCHFVERGHEVISRKLAPTVAGLLAREEAG